MKIQIKSITLLCIAVFVLLSFSSCSYSQKETVTVEIGETLPSNKEITSFNRKYSADKKQIIQKLMSAEYIESENMTDDFEAARITFDETSDQVLLLAFDYRTDVLYAQYADDIYTVENYEQLVSFISSFTEWNQYTLLGGVPDLDGEFSEADGSTVYWEGSWRIKKYFYNNDLGMENVYIYNESTETAVKTPQEILDKSLDILKFKEKHSAFLMYDETSDKWLVEVYSNEEGAGEAFYDVVLDRCGNVLWIDSPWGLELPKKA